MRFPLSVAFALCMFSLGAYAEPITLYYSFGNTSYSVLPATTNSGLVSTPVGETIVKNSATEQFDDCACPASEAGTRSSSRRTFSRINDESALSTLSVAYNATNSR